MSAFERALKQHLVSYVVPAGALQLNGGRAPTTTGRRSTDSAVR